jgi:GTPase SAR1 family protein
MINTAELKSQIDAIINRYNLSDFKEQLNNVIQGDGIKIGFLGAFSSGKTSLLNSIFTDLNLPVDIAPTTKSICFITPKEGITQNEYYRDNGTSLDPISIMDFNDIVDGSVDATAVIKTPASNILPMGTVFVDTPGFDSIGTEVDLTTAFLNKVDAAIFCLNGTAGTLPQNILEFLQRPDVKRMADYMVFAITHKDHVKQQEDRIQKEIQKQLSAMDEYSKIDWEKRIFFVDAKHEQNAEQVFSFVKKHILDKQENLRNIRINANLVILANRLRDVLQERLDNMKLDESDIDQKKKQIENDIQKIENEIQRVNEKLENFRVELQNDILSQMLSFEKEISSSEGTSLQNSVNSMMMSVRNLISAKIKSLLPDFDMPVNIVGQSSLVASLNNIDKAKDFGVTIATTALTAWLMPGAGLAANAAEGAGGAVVKTAASQAAKTATINVAKKSVGAAILGTVGTIIKEANPLEHVGSFIASKFKSSAFQDLAKNSAMSIANNSMISLSQAYNDEVVAPLFVNKKEALRSIEDLRAKRHEKYNQFKKDQDQLMTDIDYLWKVKA